jgi:hypothetical protein
MELTCVSINPDQWRIVRDDGEIIVAEITEALKLLTDYGHDRMSAFACLESERLIFRIERRWKI